MAEKTKVLYGVHGYGRGHAARALAILPELTRRYEVRILAGDDAYDQLSKEYPVVRIPALRYYHNARGTRSAWLTIKRSIPAALDLLMEGPIFQMVRSEIERFAPAVVLSDSEGWTHRAARSLGVPRVSFDHYGILAYCRLPMGAWDRFVCGCESVLYRKLVCKPERIVVAAFFPGETKCPGVRVVGPILRREVRETRPGGGEFLLVYFTNAREHYTPAVAETLRRFGKPVKVYHPGEPKRDGNIEYCTIANRPFVRDLASCRAVFSTAGNQLISEAIHFGKPLLLSPEEALEQRLNAQFVSRWRIGEQVRPGQLRVETLRGFWDRCEQYAANVGEHRRDGLGEAWDAIRASIDELAG